jgi:hypothetical protein
VLHCLCSGSDSNISFAASLLGQGQQMHSACSVLLVHVLAFRQPDLYCLHACRRVVSSVYGTKSFSVLISDAMLCLLLFLSCPATCPLPPSHMQKKSPRTKLTKTTLSGCLAEDGDEIQNALAQMTGQRTVPNVFIGGESIGGCDSEWSPLLPKVVLPTYKHKCVCLSPLCCFSGALAPPE